MTPALLVLAALLAHPEGGTSTKPKPKPVANPLAQVVRPYDARHYRIEARIDLEGKFEGRTTVKLVPAKALKTIELDALVDVSATTVNGEKATFTVERDDALGTGVLSIQPRQPLAKGKEALVEVRYTGAAVKVTQGLFLAPDPDRPGTPPAIVTHFEPTYARRFFPCNDAPADKATTELSITVPAGRRVFGNGKRVSDVPAQPEGWHTVTWLQDAPHPTYAVALAIGDFETVEVDGAAVPAALHVLPGKQKQLETALRATREALKQQAAFLGVAYPWSKYDQVLVPRYFWGGMENTSLTIERESRIIDVPGSILGQPRVTALIAHELAHQWFGDLVTCRTWGDTWLNEGFATYMTEVTQHTLWPAEQVDLRRASSLTTGYFREEDGPRSHPLVTPNAPSAEDVFDRISYDKGAQVLSMLETWLGTEPMRKGLAHYLTKHAHANASSHDFFVAMQEATSKDLRAFEQAWTLRRGYPVLTPSWKWDGKAVSLTVTQRPNHAGDQGVFVFKLPVVLERRSAPAYSQRVVLTMDRAQVTAKLTVPAPPEWVNWNEGMAALARVETASVPEAEWIAGAHFAKDPLWRGQALLTLTDPLGANPRAKGPLGDAVIAALDQTLRADPSLEVRHLLLEQLDRAAEPLPKTLGPAVLQLARAPQADGQDAAAVMRVRGTALEALGEFALPEGNEYLAAGLARADVPYDLVESFARGLAKTGNVAALDAGMAVQRQRGYLFYAAVASAYGALTGPGAAEALARIIKGAAGDNEVANGLLYGLHDNRALMLSPEGPKLIEHLVLDEQSFGEDLRARALRLLDDVKTPEAKQVLGVIVEQSRSDWLRKSAAKVQAANFASGG